MSFLSPLTLAMTAVATLVITALHFLSVRRPPVLLLPTARFIVARDVRAVSRNARPSDMMLLLLRLFALWCAGVAMAGPRWTTGAHRVGHVIVADVASRADSLAVARSAGVALTGDDPVVFAWSDRVHGMRSELGAAWPIAWRAAAGLVVREPSLDSVALHVVVPAGGVESVEGWASWRRTWPGRVQAVAPSAASTASTAPAVSAASVASAPTPPRTVSVTGGPADDVVRAAFDVHMPAVRRGAQRVVGGDVRVLRSPSAATTGTTTGGTAGVAPSATATSPGVTVNWPTNGVPAGWTPARDSAGALVVRGVAIVAPWTRTSRAPATAGTGARTIARWSDGTPAALERATATGCTREVGIAVPNGSDVLLAPAGRALIAALAAPCGAVTSPVPARILADGGAVAAQASAASLRAMLPSTQSVTPRWLPALLLGLAIAALLVELALRRGPSETTA
jgi:hypothetical protein